MLTPEEVSTTIQTYEEMFSYRYTMNDPEFKARNNSTIPSPPCVSNYWCKRRNYDQNRGGRGESRGNYSHRDHGHGGGGYGYHGNGRGGQRGHYHDRGGYGDRRPDRYQSYNQGR
ncbi:hypothetical protein ACJMK2_025372 [Sinanodonta woodiana]|uniref:RNA helicase n=1 Tax=Sinanodonta woodiana TaxID=1069815 RepID=A0ABD3XGC0_SINWO